MFIQSKFEPGMYECMDIVLSASPADTDYVAFPALVIRSNSRGFAIIFRGLDDNAEKALRGILYREIP